MFIVFLGGFTALFAWALWRVAGDSRNQPPGQRDLPQDAGSGQMWAITGTGGPALGTPESLVDEEGRHP